MKKIKPILLVIILATISLQSCKKENQVAPELPPEASFITDFSNFYSNKQLLDDTQVNWKHASGNVLVWNLIITEGLAVPIASYAEAVANHTPTYQSDNTWLWEYSFPKDKPTHTAKLFGTVGENSIYWEMFISKEGAFTNFKWYTGTSMLDNSKVTWTLYNNPPSATNETPYELLSIEYNKTNGDTGNIKYMNIVPGGAENGGYIKYGNDRDSDLNAYYHIYNKGQDNLIEIEWNQANKNGRVKDEIKFKDTEWHCWDVNLEDVDCDKR